jgi:LmbE family N-acetylglucosaminyl deacetylase
MNKNRFVLLVCLVLILVSCNEREDISQFTPATHEVYPEDSILKRIPNKKALIVIAHDDDMSVMTGTISKLNKQGWVIKVISFHKGAARDSAHQVACREILDSAMFFDLDYSQWRTDLTERGEEDLYLPIPREEFPETFDKGIVEDLLTKHVNAYNPSVIFSLDHLIGAYGHPEHVFISQLVLDLAQAKKISVEYIYQSVYTPHMAERIMKRHSKRMVEWGFKGDGWENAKRVYKVNGMPQPTTQVSIFSEAREKMDYLTSYNEREQKTIGFFVPAFQEYSAVEYFKTFDREFFNVIRID